MTITKQPIDLATRIMLDQVSRLSDGDYEQSTVIQLFLDWVGRGTASSTAFVWFREQPIDFNDNQTLSLRVVDPIADEGVWAITDNVCNSCCHGEVWRQNAEATIESLAPSTHLGTQKRNYFQRRWNEHDKWKAENSHGHTTARVRHGDTGGACMQMKFGKRHILCYCHRHVRQSWAGQKRVRDGSMTLDDCDAQSLEVARQVGTGLFMIRIDDLMHNDYALNPLWMILSSTLTTNLVLTERLRFRLHEFARLFHRCDGQCSRL